MTDWKERAGELIAQDQGKLTADDLQGILMASVVPIDALPAEIRDANPMARFLGDLHRDDPDMAGGIIDWRRMCELLDKRLDICPRCGAHEEPCPHCGAIMQAAHHALCQDLEGRPTALSDETVRLALSILGTNDIPF